MNKENTKITIAYIMAAVITVILYIFFSFAGSGVRKVYAAKPGYSDVLADLQKDTSFNVEDYPEVQGNNSVKVAQIAESDKGELYVYIYQPSAKYKAEKISISRSETKPQWRLYDLTEISRSGTLSKCLVEGLTVKADALRYYDISEVFRARDVNVDDPVAGGTTDYKAYKVAKRYIAMTSTDGVHYSCQTTEVITVTAQYAGFIRYRSGIFSDRDCDAHFVAFSTDRDMEKLMQADVEYRAQTYSYSSTYTFDFWKVITGRGDEQTTVTENYGEQTEEFRTVSADEQGTFTGSGWFAETYTWDRIQTAEEFKASEDLNEAAINDVSGMQWVLRFIETDFEAQSNSNPNGTWSYNSAKGTKISEIAIMRLQFQTAGRVYNLGVVADIITGDDTPDNNPGIGIDIFGSGCNAGLPWWVWLIIAIIAVVLVVSLLCGGIQAILHGIWWIISAPFRAIKNSLERRREAKTMTKAVEKAQKKTNKKVPGQPQVVVIQPGRQVMYVTQGTERKKGQKSYVKTRKTQGKAAAGSKKAGKTKRKTKSGKKRKTVARSRGKN